MPLDFLPFEDGVVLTPKILNALVSSIIDGSIFSTTATNFVASTMATIGNRVTTLESEVSVLNSVIAMNGIREQFVLTAGQSTINLNQSPILDTELVFLNGQCVPKSNVPLGYLGAYAIIGSVLTLSSDVAASIVAGDVLIISYSYAISI